MSFTERGNEETGGGGAGVGGRELSWGGVEFEVSVPCLSREVQLEVGPVGLELGGWGGVQVCTGRDFGVSSTEMSMA